ncbi:MAG: hypothetical protein ACTHKS_00880 [Gaiellaceae bacterium]
MLSAGTSLLTTGLMLFVSFLMILSGYTKKRLELRSPVCPVCRRERKRCVCRWL